MAHLRRLIACLVPALQFVDASFGADAESKFGRSNYMDGGGHVDKGFRQIKALRRHTPQNKCGSLEATKILPRSMDFDMTLIIRQT
jgi:hypothetical protein